MTEDYGSIFASDVILFFSAGGHVRKVLFIDSGSVYLEPLEEERKKVLIYKKNIFKLVNQIE